MRAVNGVFTYLVGGEFIARTSRLEIPPGSTWASWRSSVLLMSPVVKRQSVEKTSTSDGPARKWGD